MSMLIPAECLELSKIIRKFNDELSAAQTDAERNKINERRKPYADRQMMLLATAKKIPRSRRAQEKQ